LARKFSLLAALLVAGTVASFAEGSVGDPDAPATTQAGAQGQTGTAPGNPQASASQDGAAQAGASQSAAQPDSGTKSGKAHSFCFKLTGHCVAGEKAAGTGTGAAASSGGGGTATKDASAPQKPLNLTAPDIRTVVSPEELKEPLPSNQQIAEADESDTVSVKGDKNAPDVPGGFGALWWALNHPSQAWRILAPAE
jgi:hypothetical protein